MACMAARAYKPVAGILLADAVNWSMRLKAHRSEVDGAIGQHRRPPVNEGLNLEVDGELFADFGVDAPLALPKELTAPLLSQSAWNPRAHTSALKSAVQGWRP